MNEDIEYAVTVGISVMRGDITTMENELEVANAEIMRLHGEVNKMVDQADAYELGFNREVEHVTEYKALVKHYDSQLLTKTAQHRERLEELNAAQLAIAVLVTEIDHYRKNGTKKTKKELLDLVFSRLDNAYFGVVDYDLDASMKEFPSKLGFPGWETTNRKG